MTKKRFTLDMNCIIDVETNNEHSPFVRELIVNRYFFYYITPFMFGYISHLRLPLDLRLVLVFLL